MGWSDHKQKGYCPHLSVISLGKAAASLLLQEEEYNPCSTIFFQTFPVIQADRLSTHFSNESLMLFCLSNVSLTLSTLKQHRGQFDLTGHNTLSRKASFK